MLKLALSILLSLFVLSVVKGNLDFGCKSVVSCNAKDDDTQQICRDVCGDIGVCLVPMSIGLFSFPNICMCYKANLMTPPANANCSQLTFASLTQCNLACRSLNPDFTSYSCTTADDQCYCGCAPPIQ